MLQHVPQDHARVQRDLLVLVSPQHLKDNILLPRQILHRWPARADLPAQEVVEERHDILPRLELQARQVPHEQKK